MAKTGCQNIAATDSRVNPPYQLSCELDRVQAADTEDVFCTIAVIDQRNWGGCYDVRSHPTPHRRVGKLVKTGEFYLVSENVDTAPSTSSCCKFTRRHWMWDRRVEVRFAFVLVDHRLRKHAYVGNELRSHGRISDIHKRTIGNEIREFEYCHGIRNLRVQFDQQCSDINESNRRRCLSCNVRFRVSGQFELGVFGWRLPDIVFRG